MPTRPTTAHFDALGRPFLTVARNRVVCAGHDLDGTEDSVATRVELDIEGNQRAVRDERQLPVNDLPTGALEQRIVMRYAYDMLGNRIHQLSMEAGARWMLNDVTGKPIRAWDSRGHNFTTTYDALRRPVEQTVRGTIANGDESDPRTLNRDILVDKIEYGEPATASQADQDRALGSTCAPASTGTSTPPASPPTPARRQRQPDRSLRLQRQPAAQHPPPRQRLHGHPGLVGCEPALDAEIFESSTRYDALNRADPVHRAAQQPGRGATRNVIQPVFNEANLLERVDVWLERAAEPAGLLDPGSEAPVAWSVSPTSTTTPRASASASTTRTAPARSTATTRSPSG